MEAIAELLSAQSISDLFARKFAEFEAHLVHKYGLQERPDTVSAVTAVPELVVEEPPAASTNDAILVPADAEPAPATVSPISDEEVKTTHLISC